MCIAIDFSLSTKYGSWSQILRCSHSKLPVNVEETPILLYARVLDDTSLSNDR